MNYLIKNKNKLLDILNSLQVAEYIRFNRIQTLDDVFSQIELNSEKEKILYNLSQGLILSAIGQSILGVNNLSLHLNSEIKLVFRKKNANLINRQLAKANSNWRLPETLLTNVSLFFMGFVFIIWSLVIGFVVNFFPELLVVPLSVLSVSVFSLAFVLPVLLIVIFLPNVFLASRYIDLTTVMDLVDHLYRLNKDYYLGNKYRGIREELIRLYGPF